MTEIKAPENIHDMPLAIVKNMITLATSGFGLVVALAWNEFIKEAIVKFIDPYLGKNSGLISLAIYAVVMTFLAVFVTMQLTQFQRKFEQLAEDRKKRKKIKNNR